MGRQYTIEAYLRLVEKLRAAIPGITLTTDAIVGFCGETDAQFENTLALLREVRFETVFAAAFSVRPGTPAARLVDDVPRAEKKRRLQALLELQEGIGRSANEAWVGRTTEVLVDQIKPPSSHDAGAAPRVAGRNRNNKLVHFDGSSDLIGQLVDVRVDHAGPSLIGGQAGVLAADALVHRLPVGGEARIVVAA